MPRTVLLEGVRTGLALGACVVVLAVLGLTPSLSWIPEVPLLGAAVLVPVAACALTGLRVGRQTGDVLSGAVGGAMTGAIGGGLGGLSYVLFGKPVLNIIVGLLLGSAAGAVVGAVGALVAVREARA